MLAPAPVVEPLVTTPAITPDWDAVVVTGCRFEESAETKREKRPPLQWGLCSECKTPTDFISLRVAGGRVVVKLGSMRVCSACQTTWSRNIPVGEFIPGEPKGPIYTGPITPSMWVIIRRHWSP